MTLLDQVEASVDQEIKGLVKKRDWAEVAATFYYYGMFLTQVDLGKKAK